VQKCEWQSYWDTESTRMITSIQDLLDELDVV
jgi:hypothetical protein